MCGVVVAIGHQAAVVYPQPGPAVAVAEVESAREVVTAMAAKWAAVGLVLQATSSSVAVVHHGGSGG